MSPYTDRQKSTRLIVYHELRERKGIRYSRMQLARLMAEGRFPQKIPLSTARIAWDEDEIDAWIEARRASRSPSSSLA